MNVNNVSLETVCGITSTIPKNLLPEVAFAGKSNVGKSSLLNGLINRKSLARTSSQPGKTQTINFYNVEDKLYFVDLPGYGYAKVSAAVREKWGKMIEKYLRMSKQLKCVFLLVDIRHEPGANDRDMYAWIVDRGYRPVVIATKLDKISKGQVQRQVSIIRKALGCGPETAIIPFSAETKQGKEKIWELIEEVSGLNEQAADSENVAPAEPENVEPAGEDGAACVHEENTAPTGADRTKEQN